MAGRCAGRDPLIQASGLEFEAADLPRLVFRMRSGRDEHVQVFWATSLEPMSEQTSAAIEVAGDGQFHDYELDLSRNLHWRGLVRTLRIDPAARQGGTFAFDYIRLQGP